MALARGRSVMALFSSPNDINSHRVRFVLAEKGINVEIVDVDPTNPPEDLIDLNPYQTIPTLVDRDVVLYDSGVIAEYLDERYPHPPLMPVDPVSRSRLRLALYRLMRDWYRVVPNLESALKKESEPARKRVQDELIGANEVFALATHFLSEELTLVDCALGPFMWRLERYGISVPSSGRAIHAYCKRIFSRTSFQESLTEAERDMRS